MNCGYLGKCLKGARWEENGIRGLQIVVENDGRGSGDAGVTERERDEVSGVK